MEFRNQGMGEVVMAEDRENYKDWDNKLLKHSKAFKPALLGSLPIGTDDIYTSDPTSIGNHKPWKLIAKDNKEATLERSGKTQTFYVDKSVYISKRLIDRF